MKIIETQDGTVKVIELDPTKHYWLILEESTRIRPEDIRRGVDGIILYKRHDETIQFVENADRVLGAKEDSDAATG